MQFLRRLALGGALLVAPIGAYAQGAPAVETPARARNVILFLADVGGVSTLHAASLLGDGGPIKLHVEQWPYLGPSETSSVDEFVSDPPNGMSSIVTDNGVISHGPDVVRGKSDGVATKRDADTVRLANIFVDRP